jgi:hypothetical protein
MLESICHTYKVILSYLQILRSSFGPLDLFGRKLWRYSGSRMVRAKTGAAVPPAGPLFLLLSVFIADVCFGDRLHCMRSCAFLPTRSDLHKSAD